MIFPDLAGFHAALLSRLRPDTLPVQASLVKIQSKNEP